MAARAIWKGILQIGGTELPVKLYSAVQDTGIHFHLLDARTKARVVQHMVDAESGEQVEREEIRMGYQVSPGRFVVVDKEELASVEPEASRAIEVTRFVSPEKMNHQWYDRPYYAGPDGDAAAYFALAEALENKGLEGIARWVMRKREYVGALRAENGYIVLVTLRHADEVLPANELPEPSGRAPDARELKMAEQLVSTLEDEFRPEDYKDEYRNRVLSFLRAKARGGKPKLQVIREKAEPDSLMDALAASLKGQKKSA